MDHQLLFVFKATLEILCSTKKQPLIKTQGIKRVWVTSDNYQLLTLYGKHYRGGYWRNEGQHGEDS